MAKFSDEDLKPAMNPAREGAESAPADSSDAEDLDQYGVWVKAGPEDLGGDEWDDNFEISDLGVSEESDLLTDEEESLLSELEETITPTDAGESLDDIHGLSTDSEDLFAEGETIIIPDLSEDELTIESFDETPRSGQEPIDEIFPEEELISLEPDLEDMSAESIGESVEQEQSEEPAMEAAVDTSEDLQAFSEEPLPDISFTPEESFSETEFSFDTAPNTPSDTEHQGTDSEFTEISLDEFSDFASDPENEPKQDNESDQDEDFLDLDLDLDTAEPEDAGESIFTDEELDDFFGVPIEDFSPQEESPASDSPETGSTETVDLPDHGTGADDESAAESGTISLDDFPSFDEFDPEQTRSGTDEVQPEPAETAEDETGLPDIDSLSFADISIPSDEPGIGPDGEEDRSEILPELQAEAVDEVEEVDAADESVFGEGAETIPESEERFEPEDTLDETIESVEREIRTVKESDSLESSILLKIERELATIKSELSELKLELSTLRGKSSGGETVSGTEAEPAEAVSGFFDDDEDDTIALTGDELDNILNTADITEENVGEPEEEPSLELSSEPEQESSFGEQTLDEFVSRDEDLIPLEEPEPAEQVGAAHDGEDDEADEATEDSVPEDTLQADYSEEITMDEPELEPEDSEADSEPLEQPSELDVELMPEFEELDPDALTLETEEEPEPAEEEAETAFDEAATPIDAEDHPNDEIPEPERDAEDVTDEELRLFDEPLPEDLIGEESVEAETDETEQPPFEELSVDSFSVEDEQPEIGDDLEPTAAETENSPSSGEADGTPDVEGSLKDEIKSVLSYMDTLLEALPEEKIQEFAHSEHFDVYRKLFEELGLGK